MSLKDLRKTLTFQDLITRSRQPRPCYVGSQFVPVSGKVLIGGEAKIGKSFVSMEIARALATGTCCFGRTDFAVERPVRVLLCDKELGADSLGVRLAGFFAGASAEELALAAQNIFAVSGNPDFYFDDRARRQAIQDKLDEVQPNVLIIDPVSKFMQGSDSDNDHVKHFLETMDILMELHEANGLSVIMSHHFRKPQTDFRGAKIDPTSSYNFRGGSKWYDDMDSLVTMQRHDVNDQHWRLECEPEFRHGASPQAFWLDVKPEAATPVLATVDPRKAELANQPLKRKLLR